MKEFLDLFMMLLKANFALSILGQAVLHFILNSKK